MKDAKEKDVYIERLRFALDRQGDNMAFILNHMDMPRQWSARFERELSEDRKLLKEIGPDVRGA